MTAPTPNATITAIRGLLPAAAEVRRVAASLPRPLDPVVAAYLHDHCPGWDRDVRWWFDRLDLDAIDPHVDVTLQPGPVIEILDWSAVWIKWRPCRRTVVRLLEPPHGPTLEALRAIDRWAQGQLSCDLRASGRVGAELEGRMGERERRAG